MSTLILAEDASAYDSLLCTALPQLQLCVASSPEAARPFLAQTRVILGQPDMVAAVLDDTPQLRWVQSTWAGVKPLADHPRRDYQLTGLKDIFAPLMTEYVFGWILALAQGIPRHLQQRQWHKPLPTPLAGRRLGIMGTGSIARQVAQQARLFGMEVVGLNTSGADTSGFDRCYALPERSHFAQDLDYLLALLPDTRSSNDLIDRERLQLMNKGAVVINAGRGNCLVDADLLEAIDSGHISHAVLDVFRVEPLPADHPFWQRRNIHITGHTAAPSHPGAIVGVFCDNWQRYRDGEPLRHRIDFDKGY